MAQAEAAALYWRPRADERRLRTRERLWTLTTVGHVVPFLAAGALLMALDPVAFPVALGCVAHAWLIPMLYARRGANVLAARKQDGVAQARALGLLGDLVGHDARDVLTRTGLLVEPGRFGVWVLGEAGAVLVRPGGRIADCWCVRVADAELPPADRTAHLLLALREDEAAFATVANLAFAGAPWRVGRLLEPRQRPALKAAVALARFSTGGR